MITVSTKPREIRVLPRGNWLDDSGEVVTPAIPSMFGKIAKEERLSRLDLANWFVSPDQYGPFTARVFANRFWYLLFGTGFSNVLDDFGGQGEPPTHPQLLDNLAIDFIENAWDVKRALKQIVMSRAYQQSSVALPELQSRDPDNRLYAHQSSYRLPAEMIRDNALAISGLLNLEYGGKSAKPYQPAGYYRHLNFPTRRYRSDQSAQQYRRGVYVHWQRMFLHPMMKAFDAPTREECTAQRARSNTPLASLILLNDPTFVEAARAFAARIVKEGGKTSESRIQFAYESALGRKPTAKEHSILIELLKTPKKNTHLRNRMLHPLIKTGFTKSPNLRTSTKLSWHRGPRLHARF